MTQRRAAISLASIMILFVMLAGCAPSSLYSIKAYRKIPPFKSYSGADAAHLFVAYKGDFRFSDFDDFHNSGSSRLLLDGQRIRPSSLLQGVKLAPGNHSFKLQGEREVRMNPVYGYDPENYPKTFFSSVVKEDFQIKSREVVMLLMFWNRSQYSYFLIPLGTVDQVKRFPQPKPGTTVEIGSRKVSPFVLEAFHQYSAEIAERFDQ